MDQEKPLGDDPLVGKVLSDRFELVRLLDRGGMGKIYEARQRPLDRPVALKILDVPDGGEEFRSRFFLEASSGARLTHPNTVRVYDYGCTDDGIYYIAMELLKGETLHALIEREAPLRPLRAIRLIKQVCGALAEAHEALIVHRDLKPANILLTSHGDRTEFVKVVDFGLAKDLGGESEVSRSGHVLGSPLYMAPEQVHGRDVDARTDVYAVGLVLYVLLTGQTAFKKGNPLAVLMAQAQKDPPPFAETAPELGLPESLEWVVTTCLQKSMPARFASMPELLRALQACELELRGQVEGPLRLGIEEGRLVLPPGLDLDDDDPSAGPADREPPTSRPPAPTHTLIDVLHQPEDLAAARRGWLWIAAGAAAVVVLASATGAAVVAGWVARVDPLPPAAPTEQAPALPAAPAPEPAPPALRAEVVLVSTPPGAEVRRGGALVGQTPLTVRLADGEEWSVTVGLEGYQALEVVLTSGVPRVDVALSPVAPSAPPPAERPPRPPAPRKGGDIRSPWE